MKRSLITLTAVMLLCLGVTLSGMAVAEDKIGRPAQVDSADAQLPVDTFFAVDSMPQMIQQATPVYPKAEKEAGVQGEVWVKALVSRNGNVVRATILKPNPALAALEKAAIDAALQSKFTPAKVGAKTVPIWVTYKVSFVLTEKEAPKDQPKEEKK